MPVTIRRSQRGTGYRLRLSPWNRWVRTAVLLVASSMLLSGVFGDHGDTSWRLLSIVGLAMVGWSLRVLHGPAVVITEDCLRLENRWPFRREIAWYRILHADIVPGFWTVELELNSGELVELPCVDHLDSLYECIDHRRHELGS